jgi:hypothetical protein
VSARAKLGHTEAIAIKLHPDLKAHVEMRASENYCSTAEFIRQLVIADKRAFEANTHPNQKEETHE